MSEFKRGPREGQTEAEFIKENSPVKRDARLEGIEDLYEDDIAELKAEIARLRDIIARRLACDGSDGTWDARLHLDLTEEMRAAVKAETP